jgi:hypothetical protein
MSADSVPLSKTNIFQSKLIYCRHFRTYSRCAMFEWSDTVIRRRNVTRRRISNTVLQPRYWGREADSPKVCRLSHDQESKVIINKSHKMDITKKSQVILWAKQVLILKCHILSVWKKLILLNIHLCYLRKEWGK